MTPHDSSAVASHPHGSITSLPTCPGTTLCSRVSKNEKSPWWTLFISKQDPHTGKKTRSKSKLRMERFAQVKHLNIVHSTSLALPKTLLHKVEIPYLLVVSILIGGWHCSHCSLSLWYPVVQNPPLPTAQTKLGLVQECSINLKWISGLSRFGLRPTHGSYLVFPIFGAMKLGADRMKHARSPRFERSANPVHRSGCTLPAGA